MSRLKRFSVMQGLKNLSPVCLLSQEVTAGCAPPKQRSCQERRRHGIWETRNQTHKRGKRNPQENGTRESQDINCAMNSNNCASAARQITGRGQRLWRNATQKMKLETMERRFTHQPEYLGMTQGQIHGKQKTITYSRKKKMQEKGNSIVYCMA